MSDPYWSDDWTTLYQGDCREMLRSLPVESVDVIITDPPYSAAYMGAHKRTYESGSFKLTPDEYKGWVGTWFPLIEALTPRIVLTPGIGQIAAYPQPQWVLCWHKPSAGGFNRLGGFNAWEPIFIWGGSVERLGQDYYRLDPRNFLHGVERDHPCPKPIELMRWLVKHFSRPGETVLDPFMGSGSTLRAAKDLGRKAIGVEIEERYCEMAKQRMAQAVLL